MNDTTIQRAPRNARAPKKSSAYYDIADGREPDPDNIHEDYGDFWETQKQLPMPDPMPGFVDRWVRIGVDGKVDHKNIRNKMRMRGYKPRDPKTAPNMPISMMGDSEVIGDEDNVLMTRPEWMERKERDVAREAARDQMREVHRTVHGAKGGHGLGGLEYEEDRTKAERGRPAPIDDDPAFA